jgi:hypothetical protein
MEETLFVIGAFLIIYFIKIIYPAALEQERDRERSKALEFQGVEAPNNKIVMIRGVAYESVRKAIKSFCKQYNKKSTEVQPRLYKLPSEECAITFPYDLDFETFCYFVNFLKYPIGVKYESIVTAWTNINHTYQEIPENMENKKVMLFIPEDDKEYDHVFLTTEDNIVYKFSFSAGYSQPSESPKNKFIPPPFEMENLTDFYAEDFR